MPPQCCGSGSSGYVCFWTSRIRLRTHSISTRYGSGSVSGSFYRQAKKNNKNLDSSRVLFVTSFILFIFEKWCKCSFQKCGNLIGSGAGVGSGSVSQSYGSGSVPKCNVSATLPLSILPLANISNNATAIVNSLFQPNEIIQSDNSRGRLFKNKNKN